MICFQQAPASGSATYSTHPTFSFPPRVSPLAPSQLIMLFMVARHWSGSRTMLPQPLRVRRYHLVPAGSGWFQQREISPGGKLMSQKPFTSERPYACFPYCPLPKQPAATGAGAAARMSTHAIPSVTSRRVDGERAIFTTKSIFEDIRLWDVAYRRTVRQFPGHRGAVRGLAISSDGEHLVSCGDDCTVRLWEVPSAFTGESTGDDIDIIEPVATYQGKNAFRAVDHQWDNKVFATGGAQVDVWDHNRSEPINTFTWGADSILSLRFNPAEQDVFATTASDRSIALYDLRMGTPLRKLVMQTKTNAVAWNPREPMNFTAANEDGNCYSYDMRKLKYSMCIHKDHVSAVMAIDYSPTGREFVTGSYDRTVRIFPFNGGHSREVYHTKRMQRVFSVNFSSDSTYVLSGSDDTNIHSWKAKASEQLGVLVPREKQRHAYMAAVKQRYKHLPEINRIERHRHLRKPIYKANKLRHAVTEAERKKESRKRATSAPGAINHTHARKKRIVAELE